MHVACTEFTQCETWAKLIILNAVDELCEQALTSEAEFKLTAGKCYNYCFCFVNLFCLEQFSNACMIAMWEYYTTASFITELTSLFGQLAPAWDVPVSLRVATLKSG